MYTVVIVDKNGKVLTKRNFNDEHDKDLYVEIMTEITKRIEERKTKDVTKILKKDVKQLKKATEIEEKFIIAEMKM